MVPTLIIFLSLLGLVSAAFLRYQYLQEKSFGKKAYCLLGSNCFAVTSSKYGRTLGIKNEDLGISYYLAVASLSFYQMLGPVFEVEVQLVIFGLSLGVVVFSLYLLTAQMFLIRKYCFLCLLSIGINFAIFWLSWIYLTS